MPFLGTAVRRQRAPHLANLAADGGPQSAWSKRRLWIAAAAVFALATIAWLVTLRRYPHFLADDTFISLRYVDRLLHGRGLTWTDGERVEGYSNLLWMLIAAGLGSIGIDLLQSVQAMGVVTALAVVGALCYAFFEPTAYCVAAVLIAALIWAFAVPVAVWSLAGLEQPLVACLLAWTLALLMRWLRDGWPPARRFLVPGLLLGGISLTRPDGILFAATIAAWLLWEGRRSAPSARRIAWVVLPSAVLLAGQEVFRIAYYGEWLPNVYYVKVSPSLKHFGDGLSYVLRGLRASSPMSELALLGLAVAIAVPASRRQALLVAMPLVAWLGYLAWIGGDIFPAWRHMLPAIALLSFAAALALRSWKATRLRSAIALLAFAVPLFIWYGIGQSKDAQNRRAQRENGEGNGRLVGTVLQRGFRNAQPLLAVTNAGVVPYWSKLPCIDMLGLCDRHIARNHPKTFGSGLPGHELGDSRYLMDRNPDLILFGSPAGHEPNWTYRDIGQLPEFTANYRRCFFIGSDGAFGSQIFVNRASERIGVRQNDDEIFVPPYLMNGTGACMTWIDAQDRFYVSVFPDLPVAVPDLDLPAGKWEIVEPGPTVRCGAVDKSNPPAGGELHGASFEEQDVGGRRYLVLPRPSRYGVVFTGGAPGKQAIYGLRLRRAGS
jgi:arabinofuranosyltransferase